MPARDSRNTHTARGSRGTGGRDRSRGSSMTRRILFTAAALLWMAVIFLFSSQNMQESTTVSTGASDWIGRAFMPGYPTWDAQRQLAFAESISYAVRKCAHFAEYSILGGLLSGAADSWGFTGRRRAFLASLIGILYACTDELHQILVAGRTGQFTDVLLDAAGVLAGTWASFHLAFVLAGGLFAVYAAAFLHFTLLGRTPVEEAVFEPHPFTALRRTFYVDVTLSELAGDFLRRGPAAIREHVYLLQTESLKGLLLNILLFVPMGAMLPGIRRLFKDRTARSWHFPWLTLLFCAVLSFLIEATQYVTRLGAFDADDLLCNLIGALIGCCLSGLIARAFR